jgi:hypothetical protein
VTGRFEVMSYEDTGIYPVLSVLLMCDDGDGDHDSLVSTDSVQERAPAADHDVFRRRRNGTDIAAGYKQLDRRV